MLKIIAFFSKHSLKLKIIGALIALISILGSVYDYAQTKEELKSLKLENQRIEDQIVGLKESINTQLTEISKVRQSYNEIEVDYTKTINALNTLKSLTKSYIDVNKKDVESEISLKTNEILDEIQCSSGNVEKCKK